jgi:MoaA/NifB/PqqE/SkfB family radical SAM enzyme
MRKDQILANVLRYRLARSGIVNVGMPLVITFSVTNRCNSRCKTCNIWKNPNKSSEELTLSEIEKIFKSVGKLYFLNLSGGEPFLRNDIVDIIRLGQRYMSPNLVHIPSNGLLTDVIEKRVQEILENLSKKTFLTIKLSLDGVGVAHDQIRGIDGNFSKVTETYARLDKLRQRYPNFHLGLNTITSKFNLDHLDGIVEFARSLNPDSYVTEVAENRSELFNTTDDITPDGETYKKLILQFRESAKQNLKSRRSISRYTEASRLVYYDYVAKILSEKRQVLPCYAGLSNAHLSPFGDVWPCCILAYNQTLGNLRDFNCDFRKLWMSTKAKEVRKYIKDGNCYCPMANQSYSNMLCSTTAMAKVAKNLLFAR